MPWLGGTPRGRASNPGASEAFDRCLRKRPNPLYFRARRAKINGVGAGVVGSMARRPMKGAKVVSERQHASISALHKQWVKLEDEHHQLAIAIDEAEPQGPTGANAATANRASTRNHCGR
jgi:hypothetical protein